MNTETLEPERELEEMLGPEVPAGDQDPVPAKPARRKRRGRFVLLVLLAGCGFAWGVRFVHHILTHESTEDAYVAGSIHSISARVEGVVQEILVEENSEVTAGQPLVKLDRREFEIKRDQAKAAIAQLAAQVEQAAAQLSEADAQAKLAEAQERGAVAQLAREEATAAKAKADLERASQLYGQQKGALISSSELDAAKAAGKGTAAAVEAAHASRAAAEATGDSARARQKAARASYDAAVAQKRTAEIALEQAELQVSYTTIVAPVAGRISRKGAEVGDHIQPGQALFALVEPEIWVEANFKESQVAGMHPGQAVDIAVDALPGKKFQGAIESLSPATGAKFALIPPDNATGNFTKVVQRIPVRIKFTPEAIASFGKQIRPGLSVIVDMGKE